MSKNAIELLKSPEVNAKFNELLWERSSSFLSSVMHIVSNNDMLKDAEPKSVFSSAIVAATLNLPINPNLGLAYIVPYRDNKNNITLAQFQIGYRGFIQLALRSGQFVKLSATAVYEWQIVKEDPLLWYEFDWTKKWDRVIWYVAYFKLTNGFDKNLYMTIKELESHGSKFSQSYKKWYWLWKDEFDSMALKTVMKQLLSKYAPLSIDMQQAITADQGVIRDVDNVLDVDYPDNDQTEILNIDIEEKIKSSVKTDNQSLPD